MQELVRGWQAEIRAQQRGIERGIRDMERDRKTAGIISLLAEPHSLSM
jgi:hypothetical protein